MQNELFAFREPPVNGRRIRQARELAGLTQATLAELLGTDQTLIAHIERGSRQPAADLLEAIGTELHFPPSFFRQGSSPEFPKGSLLFRSKAVVGRKLIGQVHAHAEIVFEMVVKLASQASLVPLRLPNEHDPIQAAQRVRSLLRIPDGPLPNLIRTIEQLGVIIVPIPQLKDLDAFAVWAGPERSYAVIGTVVEKAFDRTRMNLAHELGHLILHRDIAGASQQLESDAYQFAVELLTPAHSIAVDLQSERLNLFRLASLKRRWNVSMQAIARRARDLQFITDRQYRYLMQQISMKGWRISEPEFGPLQVERPRAIRKLVEVTFGPNLNSETIAKEFRLSTTFITSLLEMCSTAPGTQAERKARRGKSVISISRRN